MNALSQDRKKPISKFIKQITHAIINIYLYLYIFGVGIHSFMGLTLSSFICKQTILQESKIRV